MRREIHMKLIKKKTRKRYVLYFFQHITRLQKTACFVFSHFVNKLKSYCFFLAASLIRNLPTRHATA